MEEVIDLAEVLPEVVPALAIVTPGLLLSILGGAIVTLLAGLLKGKLSKFSPKLVVTGVAVVLGALYYVFSTYMPIALQQSLVDFAVGSLAFAVLIYEFLYKSLFTIKKK